MRTYFSSSGLLRVSHFVCRRRMCIDWYIIPGTVKEVFLKNKDIEKIHRGLTLRT